jgi:hypothetical protein
MGNQQDGPMTDERLQELMAEAAGTYRVPKDPPLDAMWARIEREHFDTPSVGATATDAGQALRRGRSPGARRWFAPAAGIAATLLVGFGLGRFTAPAEPGLPPVVEAGAGADSQRVFADPLQRTTSEYLDDAELLLASLPRDAQNVDPRFVDAARQLLTTTRLLLDSPVGSDPRLRDMLEDLELVLAQMARLRGAPRAEELTFIADAMDERDMVPRLRTVAAALSNSDY